MIIVGFSIFFPCFLLLGDICVQCFNTQIHNCKIWRDSGTIHKKITVCIELHEEKIRYIIFRFRNEFSITENFFFSCNCFKTVILLFVVAIDAFLLMDTPLHPDSLQLIFLLICKTAMVWLCSATIEKNPFYLSRIMSYWSLYFSTIMIT